MKNLLTFSLAIALLVGSLTLDSFAGPRPGEIDFGKFSNAGADGKFVELNLKQGLISLAASFVEDDQPEVAKLLRAVHLVRVNVVGVTEKNRAGLEKRMKEIRGQLDQEGWERVVAVQEKNGEDVCICLKTRNDEALEGVVITVIDGKKKEAVFVNLVGDIKPEQLTAVGKALNIEPLAKAGAALEKK